MVPQPREPNCVKQGETSSTYVELESRLSGVWDTMKLNEMK